MDLCSAIHPEHLDHLPILHSPHSSHCSGKSDDGSRDLSTGRIEMLFPEETFDKAGHL